ncbi:MAG TPA: hypothetical protein VMS56_12265 [Thermoanaerobaculia bacterium]|nr:hypothetical protein [Thermoanaerobaculia bacterium]
MTTNRSIPALIAAMALAMTLGACKHSGVAVASGGQIINIDIDAPRTLTESEETKQLEIEIANRGVSKLSRLNFDVIMPVELIVQSQTQSPGVTWTERVTAGGQKLYHYEVDQVSVGSRARVTYHINAAYGSTGTEGKIEVTAWSDQLPGDRLIETKSIAVRR